MNSDRTAWAAYEPTARDPWDLRKVAHLHRRGLRRDWADLHRDVEAGPDKAVDRLLNVPAETPEMQEVLAGLRDGIRDAPDRSDRLQAYWIYRLLLDPNRLRENMTLFWHNHFATSNAKVRDERLMVRQNELLRSHALGDLPHLLDGVLRDPAMLIWLDGANSPKARAQRKPRPRVLRALHPWHRQLLRSRCARSRPCIDRLGREPLAVSWPQLRIPRARIQSQ